MALVMKLDAETKAPVVTEDSKIIYYDDQDPDKKELPLDPAGMYLKIGDLGKANQKDRDKYKTLRDLHKPFEGIEDLSEWKEKADKALVDVENFNDKDWMKADKVEKLKADMTKSYEGKITANQTVLNETIAAHADVLTGKDAEIRRLMVSNKFASSIYFVGEKKKTILPPDIGESYFGQHFKVEEEDGKSLLKAYHTNGDAILSRINPGEPARFEEAMGIIIDAYPHKDGILTAPSGGSGGGGGGQNEDGDPDDLASLKQQHKDATAAGQVQLAISLKNKIFALEHPDK